MADLDAILREAHESILAARSLPELTEVRARVLGRKGSLTAVLRELGSLSGEERARAGREANEAKERIEAWAAERREALEAERRQSALAEGRLDVTLPGAAPRRGRLHPVTHIEREMCEFFLSLGYSIADGPEVDTDYHNFGALNFPDDHPARDLQDTFFVEGGHVLRTHTSNVQIRVMSGRQPPFRFVAPGRVYRHDLDATHYPMFHQIEAFCVDEHVTFADLKGTLYAFARHLFGRDVKLRFRAHFFPFTEPSAEIDFWWRDRWLEWGGCGMIHPTVLRNCGIDPERWQGFAFGMGIDRTAMDRWGIPHIQLLYEGDVRVLEQVGMKFSLAWLREWVEWPVPTEALEERLTLAGLEIEERLQVGPDLSAVRVGRVEHCERHPDADRLSLCRVDVGSGEPVAIVCGAPNVAAGQKVAVALPGSELPDGTRIKRAKIRGVASEGMICSARELGVPGAAAGILVLDPAAPVGAALPDVLPVGDVILDVEITPNRGDWVSMLGMAREVRAHYGGPLRLPPWEPDEDDPPASAAVRVEIDDPAGCRRYAARIVRGVSPGKSPDWLRQRLEAAGLRSIDLIVDVTNLVMLEFGQPLHAFDLARLRGGVVRVRSARAGEAITTLDGQDRKLAPDDLVIADEAGPIAIAGVMGGSGSEVGEGTTDLLIESAHFDPVRIRRTARRLGLHSDASYRFERGVDPGGVVRAADRAARLLQELAGGKVARGVVEAVGDPLPPLPEIRLAPARVNRLLGTSLSGPEIAALLERLEISVRAEGDLLHCRAPGWRADLRQPEDLVEEVARLYGYDRLPETLPHGLLAGVEIPPGRSLAHAVRDALAAAGLVEVVTFPGARDEDGDGLRLPADDLRRRALAIANPIQAGQAWLRTHLAPSLLRAARHNLSHQVDDVAIFEVGRTFHPRGAGDLPEERLQAALLLTEERSGGLWRGPLVPVFLRAKGIAERLLGELGHAFTFRAGSAEPFLHPGASGELHVGGECAALVGEVHPETADRFALEVPAALAVIDLEALLRRPPQPVRYREVSRQPHVRRDLAFVVGRDVAAGDLLEAIRRAGGSSLASVEIFDRYEGPGVAKGRVSLAFRLVFQRTDRTLTDAEVARAVEQVVARAAERFGAELR